MDEGVFLLCYKLSLAEDYFMNFMNDESWYHLTPVLICLSYLPLNIQRRANYLAELLEEEDYYYG